MKKIVSLIITIIVLPSVLADQRLIDDCSVVIVGGSTSALAAAITSAQNGVRTCLFEPTDWPGGQMTASGVTALDFAWMNQVDSVSKSTLYNGKIQKDPRNLGKVYQEILNNKLMKTGFCWVSDYCYLPKNFLEFFVWPTLSKLKSTLVVYLHTVLKSTNSVGSQIISLNMIQRFPKQTSACLLPHEEIPDWYSYEDSQYSIKQAYQVMVNGVVVDASEWGDVLVTSKAAYIQGIQELDGSGDPLCGQAIVYPFAQQYSSTKSTEGTVSPYPFAHPDYFSLEKYTWSQVWTYRRQSSTGPKSDTVYKEDITQQNWNKGNDHPFGYFLLRSQDINLNDYQGGINLDTFKNAAYQAIGWHYAYKKLTPYPEFISLSKDVYGTCHGLSKLPYLRDTRRSVGIDQFQLKIEDITGKYPEKKEGTKFADRVALGSYNTDIHGLQNCQYPEKMLGNLEAKYPPLPYYIPFRALTNTNYQNLVVSGKLISQDFLANAATRLHPEEWSIGTAAGAIASFMSQKKTKDTRDVYDNHLSEVQEVIKKFQPIDWTLE